MDEGRARGRSNYRPRIDRVDTADGVIIVRWTKKKSRALLGPPTS